MDSGNQPKWAVIIGTIAAIVVIVGTVIATLLGLKIINPSGPTPQPTTTPTLITYKDSYLGCDGKDSSFRSNDEWLISNNSGQKDTYTCSNAGLTITQPKGALYVDGTFINLPALHDSPTHNYSVAVTASNLSSTRTCVGIEFRMDTSSLESYDLEVCGSGIWVLTKYIGTGTSGMADPLQHGKVPASDDYQLTVQVDHNTLTAIVGPTNAPQVLPPISLDPSYTADNQIGVTLDTGQPLIPDTSGTSPGGSATFSQFTFQPLVP
jgi:hypothetical protein